MSGTIYGNWNSICPGTVISGYIPTSNISVYSVFSESEKLINELFTTYSVANSRQTFIMMRQEIDLSESCLEKAKNIKSINDKKCTESLLMCADMLDKQIIIAQELASKIKKAINEANMVDVMK